MSCAFACLALLLATAEGAAPDAGAIEPGALDAGSIDDAGAQDAGGQDDGAQEEPAKGDPAAPTAAPVDADPLPAFPARINEQASPLNFRLPLGNKDARTRAREASDAMESALVSGITDAPMVEIDVAEEVASVRVQGRAVATLTAADARADGATAFAPWAAELETRLIAFVRAEELRHSAQGIALRIFVFVALVLLAFLTIRVLRSAFGRFERSLEEREVSPTPLKLFGVPLLSGEAVRGVSLVVLFVGRILAYCAVVGVALLSGFSQFDRTRPWIGSIMSWALSPVVSGADVLLRALPGILLAAVLIVMAAAAVRLARLLLDDIGAGRVPSRIDRTRTRPARTALTTAIVLVAAPLAIGAAFLRFGTPLETLALYAGGAVAVAAVPVIASAVVGGVLVWRSRIRVGDWVTVGRTCGEVASIDLLDVTIVPSGGGSVVLPMLSLAVLPLTRLPRVPEVSVELSLKRTGALVTLEETVLRIARGVDANATLEWVSVSAATVELVIRVPHTKPEARSALVRALALAGEKGELPLVER